MRLKEPKDTAEITWTKHSIRKMRFYGLSESRLKIMLRNFDRKEEGIAPNTTALMKRTGSKNRPTEIWMMYRLVADKVKIISAWRYPGTTKKGEEIPVPQDILDELTELD